MKPNTTILHSEADETVSIGDSRELLRNSRLPESSLIIPAAFTFEGITDESL